MVANKNPKAKYCQHWQAYVFKLSFDSGATPRGGDLQCSMLESRPNDVPKFFPLPPYRAGSSPNGSDASYKVLTGSLFGFYIEANNLTQSLSGNLTITFRLASRVRGVKPEAILLNDLPVGDIGSESQTFQIDKIDVFSKLNTEFHEDEIQKRVYCNNVTPNGPWWHIKKWNESDSAGDEYKVSGQLVLSDKRKYSFDPTIIIIKL